MAQDELSPRADATERKSGGIVETVKTVVYALAIAVGIRTVALEPFNIPSGSMIPTLLIGDYLFVGKYSYGYSRYSMPFGPPLFSGRILASEPQRGDVAVFKWPRDNETNYIKRVIGLPGDTIELRNGRVIINGTMVEREPVPGPAGRLIDVNTGRMAQRYIETLPGGRQHVIQEFSDDDSLDQFPAVCAGNQPHCPITVPAGSYFMMGDNRDNSSDSRVPAEYGGVGLVPWVNFVGRAEFLFFSFDNTASLWEVWKWPFAIRFDRLFDKVT